MGSGQGHELRGTGPAQPEAHDPVVVGIGNPFDEPGPHGPVDELHCAVVAEEQVIGDVADRRWRAVTPYGEEELMLRAGQPDGLGFLLAPPEEPAQAVA